MDKAMKIAEKAFESFEIHWLPDKQFKIPDGGGDFISNIVEEFADLIRPLLPKPSKSDGEFMLALENERDPDKAVLMIASFREEVLRKAKEHHVEEQ